MARNVSRLDRIIKKKKKLQKEANDIYDVHVDVSCAICRRMRLSCYQIKAIAEPAGQTINHVKAFRCAINFYPNKIF
jgi:hypothetical protein